MLELGCSSIGMICAPIASTKISTRGNQMSNGWASVGVAYRGVKEKLGRILAPFFVTVALVCLIFCTFWEAVTGSGVGGTGSWLLLTVTIAATAINAGVLGIEGTGSRALLMIAAAGMVNMGVLGIGRAGSRLLQTVAAADITDIGVLGIGETGSRV